MSEEYRNQFKASGIQFTFFPDEGQIFENPALDVEGCGQREYPV